VTPADRAVSPVGEDHRCRPPRDGSRPPPLDSFLATMYFVAYLDRVNVGFAALQMNAALGLSSQVFGTGAGIFFLGCFLFEIPSNFALARVGARIWIARIAILWGVVPVSMLLISGPRSFYAMRFLLGAAEAGFFPGIVLYFTYCSPRPSGQARSRSFPRRAWRRASSARHYRERCSRCAAMPPPAASR
jgi:MFS family permease